MGDPAPSLFTRGQPGDADTRGESMVIKHLARQKAEAEAAALEALARAAPGTAEAVLRVALEACAWDATAAQAHLREFMAASGGARPRARGDSSSDESSDDSSSGGGRKRKRRDKDKKSKKEKKEKRDKHERKKKRRARPPEPRALRHSLLTRAPRLRAQATRTRSASRRLRRAQSARRSSASTGSSRRRTCTRSSPSSTAG